MKQGDITLQDQATVLPVAYVDRATRDMTAASGVVAYTGVGFKPSRIQVFGGDITNQCVFWGMSDITNGQWGQFLPPDGVWVNGGSDMINVIQNIAGSLRQEGVLTSFDSDGFTITWERIGVTTAATAVITFTVSK